MAASWLGNARRCPSRSSLAASSFMSLCFRRIVLLYLSVMAGSAHFCSASNPSSARTSCPERDALFRSCAAISSVPDSLCFPFFTQAINKILSTSPCRCLVGFPLHPDIASLPLCAPASTAHSLYALLSTFRLSGSPPLGMTSLLLACTLFSLP